MIQLYHNHITNKMPVFRAYCRRIRVLRRNMDVESFCVEMCVKSRYIASFESFTQETGVKKRCQKNTCVLIFVWYFNLDSIK